MPPKKVVDVQEQLRRTRAKEELRCVKTWHFNPFCRSIEEATAWLLRGAPPAVATAGLTTSAFEYTIPTVVDPDVVAAFEGHAVAYAGTAVVVAAAAAADKNGAPPSALPVKHVSLAGIDPSFFLSTVALGDAAEGLSTRIGNDPHLQTYRGWDVEVAAPGDVFETDMLIGNICAFVSTVRKHSSMYFDFVAYQGDQNANFCNQRPIAGLVHSGDLHTSNTTTGSALLHYLAAGEDLAIGQPVVLAAVGFGRHALREFQNQLPAVCVPCPEARVVRMLPCPLDEASVGDHTMACIATVTRLPGGRFRYVALAPVTTMKDVDTCTMDSRVKACVAAAVTDSGQCIQGRDASVALLASAMAQKSVAESQPADESMPSEAPAADPQLTATAVPDRLVLVEQGLGMSEAEAQAASTQVVFFGRNLSTTASKAAQIAIFPCLAGSCSGVAALALAAKSGLPAELSPGQYTRWLNGSAMRIVHVTDVMTEAISKSGAGVINAVFVVHPQRELSSKPTVPRQSKLDAMLCDVNISAVSAIAGPQSIVIIALNERRYWYRGVTWPGLVDRTPRFGADVTNVFSDAKLLAIPRGRFRAPTRAVLDRRSKTAEFNGRFVDAESFTRQVCEMDFPVLAKKRKDIEAALAQFAVLMSPAELEPVTRALTTALTAKADQHVSGDKSRFMDAIAAGREQATVRELGAIFLRKTRVVTAGVQWLINSLGSIMSVKGTVTRRHELGRLQRKASIAENVSAVKNMSREELWQLLEDETSEAADGTLVAHFPSEAVFVRFLSAISTTMLEQTYNKLGANQMNGLVKVESRMARLDCYTVAALLENAETGAAQPNRFLAPASGASERSLCVAGINDCPAVPIPLLSRYVDMKHPEHVDWLSECNVGAVAKVRILLRGTISQCVAAGRFSIPPMARDIGYALVDLLFEALNAATEGFRSTTTTKTWSLGFNHSLAQTARGIMGLILSTLASSATPLSPAWKMSCESLRPNLPEKPETVWMYGLVAANWHLTCWDPSVVSRNAAYLALLMLRRFALVQRLPIAVRLGAILSSGKGAATSSSTSLPLLVRHAPTDPAAVVRATVDQLERLPWDTGCIRELVEDITADRDAPVAATEDSMGQLLFDHRIGPRSVADFWNLWAGACLHATGAGDLPPPMAPLDILRWTVVALVDQWTAEQLLPAAAEMKVSDPYAPSKRHVSAAAAMMGAASSKHKRNSGGRRPEAEEEDATTEPRCYRCGKRGHFASECERDDVLCFKCHKGGHIASACTAAPRPRQRKESRQRQGPRHAGKAAGPVVPRAE